MKKAIMFLYLALIVLLIVGLGSCRPEKAGNQMGAQDAAQPDWFKGHEGDATAFAKTYPVSKEHPFVIATYDELITHLKWGTGVIVFAFPSCPRCRNAFPVLEQAFKEMNMDQYAGLRGKIVYYDIYDDREENNERYRTIVDYLKEFLPRDEYGNPRIYSPHVFFLGSGRVVGEHLDTVPSLKNPRDPLNDEQKEELLEIYKDLLSNVEACGC